MVTLKQVEAVLMEWSAPHAHDFRCDAAKERNEKCPHERCLDALVCIESAKNHVRSGRPWNTDYESPT